MKTKAMSENRRESVSKRLTRLETKVKRLEALLASERRRPHTPNATTIEAMEEARRGEFTFTGSVEDFKAHLRPMRPRIGSDANG
jgi:hypothetical protein